MPNNRSICLRNSYKYKIILILMLVTISVFTPFLTINSNAESKYKYYTNVSSDEVNDLFSLTLEDVVKPFDWIKQRYTYTVVAEDVNTGQYYFWFNVPNLQQLLYNKATKITPTGYIGTGIYPNEPSISNSLVTIPESNNAKTGLERYGFNIPNPAYIGETPKIEFSFMGVLIESNKIRLIKNKIKGLFGGSLIEAPDTDTLKTLRYISPCDYYDQDVSFIHWMELYWNNVMDNMESGQILTSYGNKKGEKDGCVFVKKTILEDTGLDSYVYNRKDAEDKNEALLSLLGNDYDDVVTNIIAFGVNNGYAEEFDYTPKRIMPYEMETLNNTDIAILGIPDERNVLSKKTEIFGLELDFNYFKIISNYFSSIIINFAGLLCQFTVFLNSFTSFSAFENAGLNVVDFWSNPLIKVITIFAVILFVMWLTLNIIKIASDNGNKLGIISKSILVFSMIGFLVFLNANPNQLYTTIKDFSSTLFNLSSYLTLGGNTTSQLIADDANHQQITDCSYWLPYFSLWTKYQTGHELTDNQIDLNSKIDNSIMDMELPKIGDKEVKLWSANLAQAFTSGPKIENYAYRTVDHYLAPIVLYSSPISKDPFITQYNFNNNGKFQKVFDLGIFLFIIEILLSVLIKVELFIEVLFEMVFLPYQISSSIISKNDLKLAAKRFGVSFLRISIWDFMISIIIYLSTTTSGFSSLFLAIVIFFVYRYIIIELMSRKRSIWRPRLLGYGIDLSSNFFRHIKIVARS